MLAEGLQKWVAAQVQPFGEMPQKDLAKAANQPLHRVHRFVNGELPFAPLTFLDAVCRVLGSSLCERLEATTRPETAADAAERAVVSALRAIRDAERRTMAVRLIQTLAEPNQRRAKR